MHGKAVKKNGKIQVLLHAKTVEAQLQTPKGKHRVGK
jgi:hypothetical protein